MISNASPRPLRTGLAAALLLLLSAAQGAAQAAPGEARCEYSLRLICTTEGCQPTESEGIYLLTPELPALRRAVTEVEPIRIQRCDAKGCGAIEITNTAEGGILTLSAMQGSYLLKLYDGPPIPESELETGAFTEVVTSMFTTFLGYGTCSAEGAAREESR